MSRVLVLATFDLLHEEHLYLLEEAAKLGKVTVGLGTDRYQRDYKRQPVRTYHERKAVLQRLPWVDQVIPREDVNIMHLLDEVAPDYLVAGVDWVEASPSFLQLSGISVDVLAQRRIHLVYICSPKTSTTTIIERIRSGT